MLNCHFVSFTAIIALTSRTHTRTEGIQPYFSISKLLYFSWLIKADTHTLASGADSD